MAPPDLKEPLTPPSLPPPSPPPRSHPLCSCCRLLPFRTRCGLASLPGSLRARIKRGKGCPIDLTSRQLWLRVAVWRHPSLVAQHVVRAVSRFTHSTRRCRAAGSTAGHDAKLKRAPLSHPHNAERERAAARSKPVWRSSVRRRPMEPLEVSRAQAATKQCLHRPRRYPSTVATETTGTTLRQRKPATFSLFGTKVEAAYWRYQHVEACGHTSAELTHNSACQSSLRSACCVAAVPLFQHAARRIKMHADQHSINALLLFDANQQLVVPCH